MTDNPFDLSRRDKAGPARKHDATTYTPEEQAQKLAQYIEVERGLWDTLRHGAHVRYYTDKKEFRVGGFVMQNPTVCSVDGKSLPGMRLMSGLGRDPHITRWFVGYDATSRVYVKLDTGPYVVLRSMQTLVATVNAHNKSLLAALKATTNRVAALEERAASGRTA